MALERLESVGDVINKLGGNIAVGKITNTRPKSVSMWRTNRALPTKTFVVLSNALAEIGFCAPHSLWGMVEPSEAAE